MNRRGFIGRTLTGGVWLGASASSTPAQTQMRDNAQQSEIFIEREQNGQPHKGKVLAAIQPHCDDLPLFAGGAILKLIREGYTGILIRTSNDEMAGRGAILCDPTARGRFEGVSRIGGRDLGKIADEMRRDAQNHRRLPFAGVGHVMLHESRHCGVHVRRQVPISGEQQ